MDHEEAVRRQSAFDDALARIGDEGAAAHAQGIPQDGNPYRSHPEPHFRDAWAGGWAEAALGIRDAAWAGPRP